MTTAPKFANRRLHRYRSRASQRYRWTPRWILGGLAVAAIVLAVAGSQTNGWLVALQPLQQNPPFWAVAPELPAPYLLAPTAILAAVVLMVMGLSPQPKTWSRVIVGSILLALTIRYVLWRAASTLYLEDPFNGVISVGLFLIELLLIFSSFVQLYLLVKVKFRNQQADHYQSAVLAGHYQPSVDVLIPTYNEPVEVLRRTVVGCQAMDYPRKTVYLLDDKRRGAVAALAAELGCEYITRADNRYAKAGNLNHALGKTQGELVAVFDADFVPSTHFLTRTVGFFQDPENALLQTHQSFFNPDPVARNLGLEQELTHEVEVFSRHYQVLRDSVDSALCYGSSFVARRSALEAVGRFAIAGLSEDYYTGINLSAQGYRVIYLNESLSAGLSAGTMADHVAQRLRWTRGTLQTLFLSANPLTIPGLSWWQRVAHFEGILQWFSSVFRMLFLLLPGAILFWDWRPMSFAWQEWVYFSIPFYVVSVLTYNWLTLRSRSVFVSDIYAVAQCFPISLTVFQTLLSPFSKGFQVTPKSHTSRRFVFHWKLALPLLALLPLLMLVLVQTGRLAVLAPEDLVQRLGDPSLIPLMRIVWLGSLYNLIVVAAALLCLLDVPKPDAHEWFALRRVVQIQAGGQQFWGTTSQLSEGGLELCCHPRTAEHLGRLEEGTVDVLLPEENIALSAVVVSWQQNSLRLRFQQMSLSQYRQLVEFIFCRPGRWNIQSMPNELVTLWRLTQALLRPVYLTRRRAVNRPTATSQI